MNYLHAYIFIHACLVILMLWTINRDTELKRDFIDHHPRIQALVVITIFVFAPLFPIARLVIAYRDRAAQRQMFKAMEKQMSWYDK